MELAENGEYIKYSDHEEETQKVWNDGYNVACSEFGINTLKNQLADLIMDDHEFEIRNRKIDGLTMDCTDKLNELIKRINNYEG